MNKSIVHGRSTYQGLGDIMEEMQEKINEIEKDIVRIHNAITEITEEEKYTAQSLKEIREMVEGVEEQANQIANNVEKILSEVLTQISELQSELSYHLEQPQGMLFTLSSEFKLRGD